MSVSLKSLPKIQKLFDNEDTFISKSTFREQSNEKPGKYISLKNLFYQQSNQNEIQNQKKINQDLCILNYISNTSKEEGKFSAKTSLSDKVPDIYNYNICMINKYNENLDSSLSFISELDLEAEEEKSLDNSFNSSNNGDSCEEQIEIKTQTKRLSELDEENNIKLEKEWNDIKELLLGNN